MSPREAGDPWRRAPTSELADQVLPRWFVLLAVVAVPLAAATAVAAFLAFGPDEVPLAARRPPPAGDLTHDVGELATGDSRPVAVEGLCPLVDGAAVAGSSADRAALTAGLGALCDVRLPQAVAGPVAAFADRGGVARFAVFERTGVDATLDGAAQPPVLLVNNRFARTTPGWMAPLVAHEASLLAGDPAEAAAALAAREAEAAVCRRLFEEERPPLGCLDAAALLALPDPLAALENAGFG